MKKLSHVSAKNRPRMVDVGAKTATRREAVAESVVRLPAAVAKLLRGGEIHGPKGPVIQTAIVAGTMAVKNTVSLIPFCHPLPIEGCDLDIKLAGRKVVIRCRVSAVHKTGVEMEALVGASTAALTVYDMCKAVSPEIIIERTRLLRKTGGKRDYAAR
jgi:cyclic pyranopterin phosphate synthase